MFVGGELCSSTLVYVREAGCPEAAGTGWQLRLNLNEREYAGGRGALQACERPAATDFR